METLKLRLKKKRINILTVMLSLFAALTILIMPTAAAFDLSEIPEAMLACINGSAVEVFDQVLFNDVSTGGTDKINITHTDTVADFVTKYNPFDGGTGKSLFALVALDTSADNPIYAVVTALKAAALVMGLIALSSKYIVEYYNTKADPYLVIMEFIIKFGMCGILIALSDKLTSAIAYIATGIVQVMMSSMTTSAPITLHDISIKEAFGASFIPDWMESVADIFILFFPFLLALLIRGYAWFVSFSILFEIGLRRAVLPLGIVEFFIDGFKSPAIRNIKKFMASILRLGIAGLTSIIALWIIGKMTTGTASESGATQGIGRLLMFLIAMLVINLTAVTVVNRSTEYANDAMGV